MHGESRLAGDIPSIYGNPNGVLAFRRLASGGFANETNSNEPDTEQETEHIRLLFLVQLPDVFVRAHPGFGRILVGWLFAPVCRLEWQHELVVNC